MPRSCTSTKLSILNFRACQPTACRLPRPGQCRKPGHFSPKSYTTTSSTSPSSGNQDPFTYCRDFVQKHDRDSYLISRFFPSHLQNACFAVRAFYVGWSMAPLDNAILFSNFYNEDWVGNDPGRGLKYSNWTDEDAILERCYKKYIWGETASYFEETVWNAKPCRNDHLDHLDTPSQ